MIEVDIIRHAHTIENMGEGNIYSFETPLSHQGHFQVTALNLEYISLGVRFDALYTSGFPRARQTAEEIALVIPDRLGRILTPIVVEGLNEPDLGKLVGRPYTDFLRETKGKIYYDFWAEDAGQEPFPQVVQRARRAFSEILENIHSGERVAVITHGTIVKIGMHMLRNPNSPSPLADHELPESDRLGYAEACHVVLDDKGRIIQEERIRGNI